MGHSMLLYFRMFVLSAATGTAVLVASLVILAEPAEAAFPGQNGKIAFTSWRDGNPEIYTMDPDGAGQINLTSNPAADYDPAFSPDGRKIAFQSYRDGNPEIYVMASNGSVQTRLTNNGPGDSGPYEPCDPSYDGRPTFSPDGTEIAFESCQDGNLNIYVMNADDGTGQTLLNDNPLSSGESSPAFSPTGDKIVFTGGCCRSAEIWTVNVDGSGLKRLTENSRVDAFPAFSPDGGEIAWSVDGEIFMMRADGSNKARLTKNTAASDLAFSPDGRKIVFGSSRKGNQEIHTMRTDGSNRTRLANNAASGYALDWAVRPR